jgi:inositol transport system ATP-binding protein
MADPAMREALLRLEDVSKSFPGVQVLKGVSFDIRQGEVLGLLGENGAGKSTLIKIIAGAQSASDGNIVWRGETVTRDTPQQAHKRGVVTIYQEFNLVPTLSVAENIFLGRQQVGGAGLVDWRRMYSAAEAYMARIGLSVKPDTLVARLPVAQQQMVEIARALSMDARLIIMDEPTAALSQTETTQLLKIMDELRSQGVAVLFVTHRLEEVMQICDRIVVLRDGAQVAIRNKPDFTIDKIIEMMVGRQAGDLYKRSERNYNRTSPVLSVRNLTTVKSNPTEQKTELKDISFDLHRGEILGLAGLVGAGRTEVARAIFGADPIASGAIEISGSAVRLRTPRDAIRLGIGLVTEDRKQQGLFLSHSNRINFSAATMKRFSKGSVFMNAALETSEFLRIAKMLKVKMSGPEQKIGQLSGGNQQKIILARWMSLSPSILIVDEPTRGIDIGAKSEVHQLLRGLADSGVGVIVISSDLPEILAVSDRILTLTEGYLSGEFEGGAVTEEALMGQMAPISRNKKMTQVQGMAG